MSAKLAGRALFRPAWAGAARVRAILAEGTLASAVVGLCLGLLALGPGLRRGFLLSYDMVFVPREPFRAALPGLAPPRAVPSDLVIAAASRVLPADIVQKIVLLAIFVLACAGVAALLEGEPLLARLAGGVFYTWNPYVGERLIIGQWALLLGYAGLPWVLRAVLRPDSGSGRGAARLTLAMLPAIIGGFAAMVITALVVIPAALCSREVNPQGPLPAVLPAVLSRGLRPPNPPLRPVVARRYGVSSWGEPSPQTPLGTRPGGPKRASAAGRREARWRSPRGPLWSVGAVVAVKEQLARWGSLRAATGRRRAAVAMTVLAVGCLPWLIPGVIHTVYTDSAGVAAFAARADTPFGSVGSLVMLGGAWNADTVPRGYGGAWSAVWLTVVLAALVGYALLARSGLVLALSGRIRKGQIDGRRFPGLGIAGVAGLVIACIGVTEAGRVVLRDLIGVLPAAALLRDAQQFVAPLALVEACGLAMGVEWAAYRCGYELCRPGETTTPRGAAQSGGSALRDPSGPDTRADEETRLQEEYQCRYDKKNVLTVRGNPAATLIGVFALVAPVVLLPGLAWGAGGRLRPAWYPASWLAAARAIDASPARGDALLLPWAADRTPTWNHDEVLLDPWPRLVARAVIWNDGTRVGDVALAPDEPRARRLDALITGTWPLTEALRAAGVRFVIDDAQGPSTGPGLGEPAGPRLPGAVKIVDQPGLIVYRLPG